MKRMDVNFFTNYIDPIYIFDLVGFVDEAEAGAVPCKIQLNENLSFTVPVNPDHFVLDYVAKENGQIVSLFQHPVPYETAEDGTLFFHTSQFLASRGFHSLRYIGRPYLTARNLFTSDTNLVTPYGGAYTFIDWAEGRFSSQIAFTPGTLTINGQNIQAIRWDTYTESSSINNARVQEMVAQLLANPQELTLNQAISRMKKVDPECLSALHIFTDSGHCSLYYRSQKLSIARRTNHLETFYLCDQNHISLVEIGLKLATCANLKGTVTRMDNAYLLHRPED